MIAATLFGLVDCPATTFTDSVHTDSRQLVICHQKGYLINVKKEQIPVKLQ